MPCYDLCVITKNAENLARTHLDVARAALEGGATIIQFRDKTLSGRELVEIACALRALTRALRATFIVNDRVDVALACDADGVHLGQQDLPIAAARRLLGPASLIGASAATPSEALACEQAGASYLGVGPIFPTPSKADAGEAIGLSALAEIRRAVRLPLLAIGGITCQNVAEVIAAGADGVAVISAVADAPDMAAAAADLRRRVREARGSRRAEEQ
ncbi:MAG: thiamine phosphate synthase [Armatimonadota bacterium]